MKSKYIKITHISERKMRIRKLSNFVLSKSYYQLQRAMPIPIPSFIAMVARPMTDWLIYGYQKHYRVKHDYNVFANETSHKRYREL